MPQHNDAVLCSLVTWIGPSVGIMKKARVPMHGADVRAAIGGAVAISADIQGSSLEVREWVARPLQQLCFALFWLMLFSRVQRWAQGNSK
eukprot:SAG31_NODE_3134_length_4638_cov_2.457810_2_plen_90_part_00